MQRAAAGRAAMFTARKKIQKEKNAEPTEFEESVAQVRRLALLMPCCACTPACAGFTVKSLCDRFLRHHLLTWAGAQQAAPRKR